MEVEYIKYDGIPPGQRRYTPGSKGQNVLYESSRHGPNGTWGMRQMVETDYSKQRNESAYVVQRGIGAWPFKIPTLNEKDARAIMNLPRGGLVPALVQTGDDDDNPPQNPVVSTNNGTQTEQKEYITSNVTNTNMQNEMESKGVNNIPTSTVPSNDVKEFMGSDDDDYNELLGIHNYFNNANYSYVDKLRYIKQIHDKAKSNSLSKAEAKIYANKKIQVAVYKLSKGTDPGIDFSSIGTDPGISYRNSMNQTADKTYNNSMDQTMEKTYNQRMNQTDEKESRRRVIPIDNSTQYLAPLETSIKRRKSDSSDEYLPSSSSASSEETIRPTSRSRLPPLASYESFQTQAEPIRPVSRAQRAASPESFVSQIRNVRPIKATAVSGYEKQLDAIVAMEVKQSETQLKNDKLSELKASIRAHPKYNEYKYKARLDKKL